MNTFYKGRLYLSGAGWVFSSSQYPHSHLFGGPCKDIASDTICHRSFSYLGQPGPLDVGVLLVADTPHHAVVVHGVDDGGVSLGGLQNKINTRKLKVSTHLSPLHGFQEERIFVSSLLGQQFVFFQT